MNFFVIVHTIVQEKWVILPGISLRLLDLWPNSRYKGALEILVAQYDSIRVVRERHVSGRNSASYWVYPDEAGNMVFPHWNADEMLKQRDDLLRTSGL